MSRNLHDFLIACILCKKPAAVLNRDKPVFACMDEESRNGGTSYVIQWHNVVCVEASQSLDTHFNHCQEHLRQPIRCQHWIIIAMGNILHEIWQAGKRGVSTDSCNGRISVAMEQRSGSTHGAAPDAHITAERRPSQMLYDCCEVLALEPAKRHIFAFRQATPSRVITKNSYSLHEQRP
jgi:hypothetical protein